MADDIKYEVITDYVNRGVAESLSEIQKYSRALNALFKAGKITQEQMKKTARALANLRNDFKSGTISKVSAEYAALVKELSAAQREFKKVAQASRGAGSLTPTKDALKKYSTQELKEFVATQEAAEASLVASAKKEISVREAQTQAEKELRKAQQARLASEKAKGKGEDGKVLTAEQKATQNLAKAQKELNAARRAATTARKSGDDEKITKALNSQAAATRKVTSAQEQLYKVQNRATASTGSFHAQLPRLRYAMYDIATSAGIAGAAFVALSGAVFLTSVRMDRQFADVVRTSKAYMDQTGKSAEELHAQFMDLFQSIPASWADITKVGTLGGQLGIAADDLAAFTELVVKFSATTNVSVEEAATAFGRLSKLLDVPAAKFENLGSSILKVGVNSVATESQIIAISSQIASIANQAGFTADQVIGLSGALASLGTQPELSRGVITRLFTGIDVAIANSGKKLEDFGELTGQTGQQFKQAWGTDAAGTLELLLTNLNRIPKTDATQTLKDLGITASRDIPTILRLAQNHQVLADAMDDASSGFADSSTLNEQYGVIAQTTAAKLEVLRNNFSAFVATLGESANSPVIGGLIDGVTKLLKVLTDLVNNPVAQVVAGLTLAFTGLLGVTLLVVSATLRMGGSYLAVRTGLTEAAVAAKLYANTTEAAAVGTITLTRQLYGSAAAMEGQARAANAATVALRGLKIASVIGIALLALDAAFIAASASGEKLSDVDLSNLADALKQDTQVYADSGSNISLLTGALDDAKDSFDGVTTAADNSTVAVGNFTAEWLRNQFANSDLGGLLAKSGATPGQVDSLIDSILGDPQNAQKHIQDWYNKVLPVQRKAIDDFYAYADAESAAGHVYPEMPVDVAEAESLFSQLDGFAKTTGEAIVEQADKVRTADFFGATTEGAEDAAAEVEAMSERIHNAIGDIVDTVNEIYGFQDALYALGGSLYENGKAWGEFSNEGRANMGALMQVIAALAKQTDGDAAATAANMMGLFNALVQGGYASAEQLSYLQQIIANLKAEAANEGITNIQANVIDLTSLLDGFGDAADKNTKKAANGAKKAAKEIRTLKDYMSDLKKVMDDAFEFRFGFQDSQDDITSTVHDISDGFEDAKQKVRDLNQDIQELQATLSGLAADRNVLEYQLSVAQAYGDTLRASEIQAELDKNASDAAKAQNDLSDKTKEMSNAQADATPTLTGTTDAAIKQREAVEELVSNMEDSIVEYAAQGHSQKEVAAYAKKLKAQLEAQLKAWGYNTADIKKYTAALDDAVKIINKVPRNLTVKADADTSPAQKALDIFFAENKDKTIRTTQVVTTKYNDEGDKKKARADAINAQIEVLKKALRSSTGTLDYYRQIEKKIAELSKKLNSGKYYSGGYTGRGGKYEPAGIVHKGEYVIPKSGVNQSTGLPYADALGRATRGAPGPGFANGGYAGISGPLQIELSPASVRQIANARGDVVLNIDGKEVARAVNNANRNSRARNG